MEQINRIEILGYVGNVTLYTGGESICARFTVATSHAFRDKNGNPEIETEWHQVVAFEGKDIQNLDKITKGCKIHIWGRKKTQKYTGSDGIEKIRTEILAGKVEMISDSEQLNCEM